MNIVVRSITLVAASAATLLFIAVLPAHAQRTPGLVVDAQTVAGNSRVTTETFLGETGIVASDTITINDVQTALRRLWATGKYKNLEPRLIEQPEEAHIVLHWKIEEQPYISRIEFRGLENVKSSTVLDTVQLRGGGPLRPGRVAAAEGAVRDLLAKKGFQLKSISHRLEPVPGAKTPEFNLVFNVEEGQRVAIADVAFEGNEVFDDDELKGRLTTRPEGFFWFRPGTYDEEKLREDLRKNLPSFYGSSGYLDFTVLGDSLDVDQQTGKARLIIRVSEGPQYRLSEFDINGNTRFSSEELRRYFEQESAGGLLGGFGLGGARTTQVSGRPFDATAFEAATGRVKQLYSNSGYLYAQVSPRIEKADSNTVRVAWDIREGNPAYVNTVTIAGNTYTHEDVIRGQLMVVPGDVYNEELLIQSYQRISSLGFFETPVSAPRIEPNEKGDVDLTFEVKEKQTGSVNFGTAVGGGTGLAGFLGYDQPNLFGQAKSGHLRWEFGRFSNNFEASYSDPAIQGSRYSGSISLFSARDRFIQFTEGRRRRTGVGLRFGIPMPNDARSRLTVGYSLARTTYERFEEEESTTLFNLPPGIQSTVTLGLQRFNLDHPMFPTAGTRQEFEASLNGGILGGAGDFQKYMVSGAWYVPVGRLGGGAPGSRPIRFTLGLSAEAGALFGDASRFPFERYWMGGVQFGRPLRGYDETTITPLGYVPRCSAGQVACPPLEDRLGDAFLRLSAEYAIRFNDNLSVSTFYDAGGVWRNPSQLNPTRLLRGAGVGAMLVTPFGPLGLDYAYGFDKDRPGWQLHFKFGQGF
ncbi:MAG: outer membrane protein assembly factor BamA [Gemmatimonadota bacterium]